MNKVLTPKEQIAALIEQEDELSRRIGAFQQEEHVRYLSETTARQKLSNDLRAVDPDLSPKEVVANSKELQEKYRNVASELQASKEALAAAMATIAAWLIASRTTAMSASAAAASASLIDMITTTGATAATAATAAIAAAAASTVLGLVPAPITGACTACAPVICVNFSTSAASNTSAADAWRRH